MTYMFEGDYGTEIYITVKNLNGAVIDISSATQKDFIFKKYDGTTVTKEATFSTDGTDGILKYTVESGLLDTIGLWNLQVHIVMPTGEWYSSIINFDVKNNLI